VAEKSSVRSGVATGLMFIVLGLGLYWMQFLGNAGESILRILLGGLGIAAYLFTRFRLLLVFGCLLFGWGIGSFGDRQGFFYGEFSLVGLGIGFIMIYLIAFLYERRAHWWPLIPGGVLLLLGFRTWNRFWTFLFTENGWPLILVIVGGLILLGTLSKGRKKEKATEPPAQ
jgi:hypothetical protein